MQSGIRRGARAACSFLCCVLSAAPPANAGSQIHYPMGLVGGRMRLKEGTKPGALAPDGSPAVTAAGEVLEITSLTSGLPGDRAGLVAGDEIIAVDGKPLQTGYMMPFRMFGNALVRAEAEDGKLTLDIRRKDKTRQVVVRLPKRGAFAETFPFDCRKTQATYDIVCENLKKGMGRGGGLRGGPVTNALGVMALLGHRTGKYDSAVKPLVMSTAKKHASGDPQTSVWLLSYSGIMLCEYYMLHPDATVQAGIEAIAKRLAASIPDHGRYGHHLRPKVNEIAYNGQGLNATTTAALWFYASAARCGVDVSLFKDACLKAFKRVRAETNKEGGVGYAWPGNGQSCMRSGQTGLAMHHLLLVDGLIDREDPALVEYDRQVGTWPSRFPDSLLEAHAVSSMGIAASTSSLAAHDREKYIELMRVWQWWLALAFEPEAPDSRSGMRYCTAYVGGPNNTGGDFYLNGHRDLTKGFNTIMHATVGFMLASTHRRLSFYGGMLPIPGLTARMLQSRFVRGAYEAARGERYALAMRTCAAALKGKRRVSELERKCAQSIYDHVEESSIAPAFERVRGVLAGEDKFRGYEALQKLARSVKGLDGYEAKAQKLLKSLETGKMQAYLAVGREYYKLKERVRRVPARLRPGMLRHFIEKHKGHYYARCAEKLLADIAQDPETKPGAPMRRTKRPRPK